MKKKRSKVKKKTRRALEAAIKNGTANKKKLKGRETQ